jgi:adenylate cyclase class 2
MQTQEIEVRFLEIDKEALIKKLISLGAKDLGEIMLDETIIYDEELKWLDERKFIRLRKFGEKIKLAYKHHTTQTVGGAIEIEFGIDDMKKAEALFEKIGFLPYRHQQKKRHTFQLGEVTFDIDTWPRVPTYVELEGPSEHALHDAADAVGLDWKSVVTQDARAVIENIYKIPVGKMCWFTFDRFE